MQTKRLWIFLLGIFLVFLLQMSALSGWRQNPYSGKLDYYMNDFTRVEVTGTSTLLQNQASRTVITNYGMSSGGDTTLPAFAGTTTCTIVTETASQAWSFKPPSGEAFILDGVTLDANDEIDVGQVVGDIAQLIRIRTGASSYQWIYLSSIGTHSDGGQS